MISLIAAIGNNNELGKNNALLWHMPADMKYFRDTTRGHTVIMGRKTFQSLDAPLPNRKNIVITRDENYKHDGIKVAHSLEEALELCEEKSEEIFIIGGAEIYKQAMSIAGKLYITHIDNEDTNADTFFPEIIPMLWNEISHKENKKNSENPFDYTFSVYEKFI